MDIVVAELLREFRRSQNEAAGSISYEGTIIQLERPGDHARFHDLIERHFFLHVRLGIKRTILVVFHRYCSHLFLCRTVLMHMHSCHEGKETRECHAVPLFKWIIRSSREYPRNLRGRLIRHLFNTPNQYDIIEPGLDRHYTTTKSRS